MHARLASPPVLVPGPPADRLNLNLDMSLLGNVNLMILLRNIQMASIPLVFLGRLVLVMHSTLIGYAIGYLPNQDPPGYPGLLI